MFASRYHQLGCDLEPIEFPKYNGTRIMMMPVELGMTLGTPEQYWPLLHRLFDFIPSYHINRIGYLTIDEQELQPFQTLRRSGKHVDGYYHGKCGAWGGGGGWGSVGNGMITVSSTPHCKAWLGIINGEPDDEGCCDHIDVPHDGEVLESNRAYWLDGACLHESLPVMHATKRQFVRLSLPSNGPWFEGYTPNPTGILPAGEILPERSQFM